MRILVCVRRLDAGGAEMLECRLAVNLAKSGHEVYLAGQYGDQVFDASEFTAVWAATDIKGILWLKGGGGYRALRAAYRMKRIVNELAIESVVTSNVGLDGIAYLARCMGSSFSHVIGHHEYYMAGDLSYWQFRLWRMSVRSAEENYAITDYVRSNIITNCGIQKEKCTTVINSIDPKKGRSISDPTWLRAEFGVDESEKVLVFVGRLVPNKGCDLLIKWLAPHLERWSARLILVGRHYTDELNQRFYDKLLKMVAAMKTPGLIKFVGHRGDVGRIIASSDVVVHFARHEGFGLVLAEALVLGVPVVATDVGGVSEIFHESPCAPVPFSAPKMFVETVEHWLFPPETSQKDLCEAARRGKARFSDKRRAREIESIVKRAMMNQRNTEDWVI